MNDRDSDTLPASKIENVLEGVDRNTEHIGILRRHDDPSGLRHGNLDTSVQSSGRIGGGG